MMNNQFSTTSPSYTIRIAVPSDLPNVLELMRRNFHFEETVFKALCTRSKITTAEKKIIANMLDDSVRTAFNSFKAIVAVHTESNSIVGINLMSLNKNPKFHNVSNDFTNFLKCSNTKSNLVIRYFQYLCEFNEKANLFDRFPDTLTILEFYAIAVDKIHRKMGLAGDLINAGIALAQGMKDISLVFGVFTSPYSKRCAQKFGMYSILEIDLLDYKTDEGELIFESTTPYNIISVMIIKI